MFVWISLAALLAWLLWYMVAVPGESHRGALAATSEDETRLAASLRGHVEAIAAREHNLFHPAELEAAARYIEKALAGMGYAPAAQRFGTDRGEARNIEAEIRGSGEEIGRASCRERV